MSVSQCSDILDDGCSNGTHGPGHSLPMTSLRNISSVNNNIISSNSTAMHTAQSHGYIPIAAKGHKESVYALAMNEGGTLLVSGGTEKVQWIIDVLSSCSFLVISVRLLLLILKLLRDVLFEAL